MGTWGLTLNCLGIYLGVEVVKVGELLGCIAHLDRTQWFRKVLAGVHLLHFYKETPVCEIVEHPDQTLAFVFNEIGNGGVVHQIDVLRRIASHVFERNFLLAFPIVIAYKKRAEEIFVVIHALANHVAKLAKRSVGINLYFSSEIVYLVRD